MEKVAPMSGEQITAAPETEEAAVTQEQVTAAFKSGFDDDEDDQQATATPPAEPPAPAATPAPSPAPEYVQVTRQDWDRINRSAAEVDTIKATIGKMPDQIYGTLGRTLDRRLAEIQQGTPTGAPVELSEEDIAAIKTEYADYPELGERAVATAKRLVGKLKGTGGQPSDGQAVNKAVSEQVGTLRGELTEYAMSASFPSWKKDVNSSDFEEWMSTQPGANLLAVGKAAIVAALGDENSPLRKFIAANPDSAVARHVSSNIGDAASLMRDFYEHRTSKPKPTAAPAPKPAAPAQAQPSMRQRQVAAAVAPRGETSASSAKAKSPFQQGFEEED